ncbi:MAG TPA: hypothetical protein VK826_09950 [Bacteroidia bacterium]|nr:hypothetical protein [Bacteroidia bacterium]
MKLTKQKEELAKRILETEDKNVIKYIQAIFDNDVDKWEEEMPEYVKKSIEKGLADADAGRTISNAEAKKKIKKWLKK